MQTLRYGLWCSRIGFERRKMIRMRILPRPDVESPYKGFWQSEGGFCQHKTSDSTSRHLQRSLFRTRPAMIPSPSCHLPRSIHLYGSSWQFCSSTELIAAIAVVLHARHEQKEEENLFNVSRTRAWHGWRPAESVRKSFDLDAGEETVDLNHYDRRGNGRYLGSINRLNPFERKDKVDGD